MNEKRGHVVLRSISLSRTPIITSHLLSHATFTGKYCGLNIIFN